MDLMMDTNKTLLKDLKEGSDKLAQLDREFPNLLRRRAKKTEEEIEVMCFFEGKEFKLGGKKIGKVSCSIHTASRVCMLMDTCRLFPRPQPSYPDIRTFLYTQITSRCVGSTGETTRITRRLSKYSKAGSKHCNSHERRKTLVLTSNTTHLTHLLIVI